MIGQTIAHYRISAKLGEGGMGAVYRAHDSRLGRDVAVKVLPESVAADAEYLARFRREAQVLAALNHPNIAAVYSVEDEAIIMELVEGPELCGPVPVAEALPLARQIAEALEAAHECGIVHRDLKPANIKITPRGVVKVLDFGLAKSVDVAAAAPVTSNSPTVTIRSTNVGTIMGTAAYMSPEQARGKPVDHRTDIWAFGAVFFELLSGKPAFAGETATDVLAAVVKDDPDWSALPAETPPRIRKLLERCLRKDPRMRLQAIGEARIAIDEPEPTVAAAPVTRSAPSWIPWLISAAALLALAAVTAWLWPRDVERPLVRFAIDLGTDAAVDERFPLAISPDGRNIAYYTRAGRERLNLTVRALDQPVPRVLAEVDLSGVPFFSPDSQWIAFASEGRVRKIALEGGPPATVYSGAVSPRSRGSWGDGDVIVFSTRTGLLRVPAAGGTATPVTEPVKSGEAEARLPQILPGGKAVLFTSVAPGAEAEGDVKAVDLRSGNQTVIVKGASQGRYAPEGRLLYNQGGSLHAVRFDPGSLRVRGNPVRLSDQVGANAWFTAASNGVFLYAAARTGDSRYRLAVLERNGALRDIGNVVGDFRNVRLSPDGTRLAYTAGADNARDIWIYDLRRDTPMRLTSGGRTFWDPVWSPDGRHIVYSSPEPGGASTFWWIPSDGSREPVQLWRSESPASPRDFTPDGKRLLIVRTSPQSRSDIWILPLDLANPAQPKAGTPEAYLNSPFTESNPAVSPDGRWAAYSSNETGETQVYVRAFPKPEGKQQISAEGGDLPVWSAQTRELLFRGSGERMMGVQYEVRGGEFLAGRPEPRWDSLLPPLRQGPGANYDLSPDGSRLFVIAPAREAGRPESRVHLLVNFLDYVDRRLDAAK